MTKKLGFEQHEARADAANKSSVASQLLAAVNRGLVRGVLGHKAASPSPVFNSQRPREEKEVLSKLQAMAHLPQPKAIEKVT